MAERFPKNLFRTKLARNCCKTVDFSTFCLYLSSKSLVIGKKKGSWNEMKVRRRRSFQAEFCFGNSSRGCSQSTKFVCHPSPSPQPPIGSNRGKADNCPAPLPTYRCSSGVTPRKRKQKLNAARLQSTNLSVNIYVGGWQ